MECLTLQWSKHDATVDRRDVPSAPLEDQRAFRWKAHLPAPGMTANIDDALEKARCENVSFRRSDKSCPLHS